MRCEEVRELLPDHALGTLDDVTAAAVRRHLRGCGACRSDALALDRGVAMFAAAAHDVTPPPDLHERVMTVLHEEWAESEREAPPARRRIRGLVPWLATAAAVVALAGALAWGGVTSSALGRQREIAAANVDAASQYRAFLHTLGGKEVRVGTFHATGAVQIEGSAILYDSDEHQSWGLVLVTVPAYHGTIGVTLVSSSGRTMELPRPVFLEDNGQGEDWLVTSADISSFHQVRLTGADGQVLATADVH
jgi:predicted anti-sigma-YlaC factor YlaD